MTLLTQGCFHVLKRGSERTARACLQLSVQEDSYVNGNLSEPGTETQSLICNALFPLPPQSIACFIFKGSKVQPLLLLASSCLLTCVEIEI